MGFKLFCIFSWNSVVSVLSYTMSDCECVYLRASKSIAKCIVFLFTTLQGSLSHPSTRTSNGSGFLELHALTSSPWESVMKVSSNPRTNRNKSFVCCLDIFAATNQMNEFPKSFNAIPIQL